MWLLRMTGPVARPRRLRLLQRRGLPQQRWHASEYCDGKRILRVDENWLNHAYLLLQRRTSIPGPNCTAAAELLNCISRQIKPLGVGATSLREELFSTP
jgi:hypothetical protein